MELETNIKTITLKNPLILASGIISTSYSSLVNIHNAGIGAVVTKSIGPRDRIGNPNPSVIALAEIRSMVNSVGLANPGYKVFREDIEELHHHNVTAIVSIFGGNMAEFIEVLEGLDDLPFAGYELNLSCPNTEKEGMSLGTDPETVYNITAELRKRTKKPLWAKVTPNVTNVIEIAEAAVKGGCDAIVAINTLKAMLIDIYAKRPILGFKKGGLSGAAIKPIGVRYVYDLYEALGEKVPIIGVGGIMKGEDIIEYMLAGASAVEIGTAFGVAYPGNKVKLFLHKLKKYMREQEIEAITEIIGGAHK